MSKIEWTDRTWNPIRARLLSDPERVGWHCTHASAGCLHCYAEAMNRRGIGTGLAYKPGHEKDIEVFLDPKVLRYPLRWRKRRRIFAGSMTDLFAPFVTDEMLDSIMAVPALARQHTVQMLTKRPDRMLAYLTDPKRAAYIAHAANGLGDLKRDPVVLSRYLLPIPNVWAGTSVEDASVKGRIDVLREVPARIRFLSIEPLIGPLGDLDLRGIHWVIIGGESGNKARHCRMDWVRPILAQCAVAGVPAFLKQLGRRPVFTESFEHPKDRKGGDMSEWPEDLRVREMPA